MKHRKIFLFIYTFVLVGLLTPLALAWINPAANPPAGGRAIRIESGAPVSSIHIRSDGNVGVGISTPAARLDVAGQIRITGGSPAAGRVLTSDAAGLATWTVPAGGLPTGTTGQTIRHDGAAWIANSFLLNTGTRIGINAASPGSRLVVVGEGTTSGTSALNVTNSGGISSLFVRDDGNVGIGTTAPGNRLQVAGTRTNTISPATAQVGIGGDDVFTYFGVLAGTPNWGTWIQSSNTAGAAQHLMLQPLGGNVGIGTAAPGSPLQIARDSNAQVLRIAIQDTNAGHPKTWLLGNDGQPGKFGLMDGSSANYRWIVDSIGNVGIGTTAPGARLDVVGNTRIRGSDLQITRPDTTGGWARGIKFHNIDGATIEAGMGALGSGLNPPHTLYFAHGGSPWGSGIGIYVRDTGNVGIGTTGPGARLHVVDGGTVINVGSAELHVGAQRAAAGTAGSVSRLALQPFGHGGGPWRFVARDTATHANLDLVYGAAATGLTLDHTGNVGIGTTAPTTRLDIEGQIRIRGGSPAAGRVLTSDAAGLATWATPATGMPSGTTGQTIRHDGTSWIANSFLLNTGTRIGINAASPGSRLVVVGEGTTSATSALNVTNSGGVSILFVRDDGRVGVGTTAPESALQVGGGGYIQFATRTGAPPAADCDTAAERGRTIVDPAAPALFVCMDTGWVNTKPRVTLSVSVSGSGTVTSSPAGISCPADCTESYTPSCASVSLTAIPATNWVFAGWSGACSGAGTCTVQMCADRSVSATFVEPRYFLWDSVAQMRMDGATRSAVNSTCAADADAPPVCTARRWAFVSISDTDEIRDMPATRGISTAAPWYFRDGTALGVRAAHNWAGLLGGSVLNLPSAGGFDAIAHWGAVWWTRSGCAGELVVHSVDDGGWWRQITNIGTDATTCAWLAAGGAWADNTLPVLCACANY